MNSKYFYKILGVMESATAAEIKASYRKLARKYHPDVSSEIDAEAQFKEISEAYATLIDPVKRAEYNQLRAYAGRQTDRGFRPPPGWPQRGSRLRGQDIHHKLALFLEAAQRGEHQQITFRVPHTDEYGCVTHREKTLKVKVPPDIMPGQRIRLAGQGAPGIRGGESGDLFLEIEFAPHPHFSIDGKDILLTLPVTEWEVSLGVKVDVPTLNGKVKVKIPPGSSDGDKLRIKGKGLAGTPPGDQFVIIQVVASMLAILNSWRRDAL